MARKAAAKPATKTAAKKAAPAKRRAVAAKTTAAAVTAAAPKQPVAKAPAAPAPVAKPQPAAPAAANVKMAKVEFSSQAVAEDYKAMSKSAFDAYMQSGNLFAANFGAINREIMSFAQATMESSLQAARAMAGASTLDEMVALQNSLSKESVDSFLAESAKLTEMSVEMANGSMEPLQNNLKSTVEKLFKPLAA